MTEKGTGEVVNTGELLEKVAKHMNYILENSSSGDLTVEIMNVKERLNNVEERVEGTALEGHGHDYEELTNKPDLGIYALEGHGHDGVYSLKEHEHDKWGGIL